MQPYVRRYHRAIQRLDSAIAPVAARLAEFAVGASAPEDVLHEAKRVVLHGLRATLAGSDHETVTALLDLAPRDRQEATVLWHGLATDAATAARLDAAQWFARSLDACYYPAGMGPGMVASAVLAESERSGAASADALAALAVGVEVQFAVAAVLMPGLRVDRGFAPIVTGAVGAAAAAARLRGLDVAGATNAIALSMTTAVGLWDVAGSAGAAYVFGENARAGVAAAALAEAGLWTTPRMFEGENGMLRAFSGEPADRIEPALAELGLHWRMRELSYPRYPVDPVTQVLVECALAGRNRAGSRQVESLVLDVDPVTADIADVRRRKFPTLDSPTQAGSDPRYCVAAAWLAGRFGEEQKDDPWLTDPAVLDLRDRVVLNPVGEAGRRDFQRATLRAAYTDGGLDAVAIDSYLGDWRNPIPDSMLADLLREEGERRGIEVGDVLDALDRPDRIAMLARLSG